MAFQLTSEAAIRDWIVTTDRDNADGQSRAELVLGRNGKAVLRGTLDTTVPKDGSKQRAGYCNMRCLRPQVSPRSGRAARGQSTARLCSHRSVDSRTTGHPTNLFSVYGPQKFAGKFTTVSSSLQFVLKTVLCCCCSVHWCESYISHFKPYFNIADGTFCHAN